MIDWTDASDPITDHFCVNDALLLHEWNRLAKPVDGLTDDIKENLIKVCEKLELVREILGCPMFVTSMFRSVDYNRSQGIVPNNDVHSMGMACDFTCQGYLTIDEIHAKLLSHLEDLGLRMEMDTQTWCHVDIHPVMNARYFKA